MVTTLCRPARRRPTRSGRPTARLRSASSPRGFGSRSRGRRGACARRPGPDLSPSQAAALATIERHGPLTPSELAAIERVQRPTATRIVARLEQEGLLDRAADPDDGRSSIVSTDAPRPGADRAGSGRARTPTSRSACATSTTEDVATLARAAEILERLQDGERG